MAQNPTQLSKTDRLTENDIFSYGPIIKSLHYYAPREALIEQGCQQLMGKNFEVSGHYMTVWAPRQRGKSWVMQQVLWRLQEDERVDVLKLNLNYGQADFY